MKELSPLLAFTLIFLMFGYAAVHGQTDNEMYSVQLGTRGKPETTMVYEFPLLHMDGSRVPLKLVTFKTPCEKIDGLNVCYGGFTNFESDNTRKLDPEKPVDTTEEVSVPFTKKGKIPVVQMETLIHELIHVNDYHWNSRPICETNWRYPECMEKKAYDFQYMYRQLIQLQKQKKIILQ